MYLLKTFKKKLCFFLSIKQMVTYKLNAEDHLSETFWLPYKEPFLPLMSPS